MTREFTNNIGCMSKEAIEVFADKVLKECGYHYTMEWTTAGDIVIDPFIYIDERHIGEYPYMAKERVLHEIAHIDTHPQDDRHGELFHSRLAELIEQFMGMSSCGKPRTIRITGSERNSFEVERYRDFICYGRKNVEEVCGACKLRFACFSTREDIEIPVKVFHKKA